MIESPRSAPHHMEPGTLLTSGGQGSHATKGAHPPAAPYYKPGPAVIEFGVLRFLITDRPTDFSITQYIEELNKHNACDVVRVCEPTYKTQPLTNAGISVHDMEFSDGSFPPKEVLDQWFKLLKERFQAADQPVCVAVHCVAGLGRAPVMVALALIEAGMKFEDAVEVIRQHRRGAFNQKQLGSLEKYKAQGYLKGMKGGKNGKNKDCCVM